MSTKSKAVEAKAKAKQTLAEKYARLAAVAGSEPKRKTFLFKSTMYRRQAALLSQAPQQP